MKVMGILGQLSVGARPPCSLTTSTNTTRSPTPDSKFNLRSSYLLTFEQVEHTLFVPHVTPNARNFHTADGLGFGPVHLLQDASEGLRADQSPYGSDYETGKADCSRGHGKGQRQCIVTSSCIESAPCCESFFEVR